MSDLSILCVTGCGHHSGPFLLHFADLANRLDAQLVLAVDNADEPAELAHNTTVYPVCTDGYIESVLDDAVDACPDGYVLRLDDDEKANPALIDWLERRAYREADHWAFPRMHLWGDEQHYILNPPLWPDLQTRLSVKAMAGGRDRIHVGSPHGTGRVADCAIEHHKFLVRDLPEREALLAKYEALQPGAGANFGPFSVPERYGQDLRLAEVV